MKQLRYFSFICTIVSLLTACDSLPADVPEPVEHTFLTGECLVSNNLIFNPSEGFYINDYRGPLSFCFAFNLDIEAVKDGITSYYPESFRDYRFIPSDAVFNQFAENSPKVREEYEQTWLIMDRGNGYGDMDVISLFYDEGASLKADKVFAGHPAGENLASYCDWRLLFREMRLLSFPQDNTIDSPFMLSTKGDVRFPIGNYDIVDEVVAFTLDIPVKVVNYLSWINDRLSNPDAPIPYQEEILHCSFTIGKNLR